ncbi:MAG: DNA polymerase III subunit delta [Acholeplasmatales bacterium]|nr:DNA polymerase III subunit delta [Acholeplasmatales bacterium]
MNNLYLLLSNDEYLIKKKVLEILKIEGLEEDALENYDLDELDMVDLVSCLETVSVLDPKRIFWVKNPSILESNKDLTNEELTAFNRFVQDDENENILIFSTTNYNKDNKLNSILNKSFKKINLDKDSYSLDDFFNKYVMDNNLIITDREKHEIMARSKDFQTLENNLIKLDCYAEGKPITMEMINLLTNREVESKIYDITQAMFEGNNSLAYTSLMNLINDSVPTSIILANIKNNLLLLLYVSKLYQRGKSQYDIAMDLNMSSGRAYHMIRHAKTLGELKIESLIKQLGKINIDVRSGNGDEQTLLELFVLQK